MYSHRAEHEHTRSPNVPPPNEGSTVSLETPSRALDLDGPLALNAEDDVDGALRLYAAMTLIREFETRVLQVFLGGQIAGTIHLSNGQEATAVGAVAALRPDDWITLTHRGHGQALAKGVSPRALLAELYGQERGCCGGHGGSMHVGDAAVRALIGNGVVGAALPIAAGLAYAERERGRGGVVVCFFGEAGMTEGDAHEALNLAALWRLPVVYLCENNLYAISTPLDQQMTVSPHEQAAAYGMPGVAVDGNNVLAVRDAVHAAAERARSGEGPTLVECLTYRQGGHKRDDPATYRPPEEVSRWLRRDPVARLRDALERAGRGEDAAAADLAAAAALDDAIAWCEEDPLGRANLDVEDEAADGSPDGHRGDLA
jgi:TPP-dependent pyruvate/acetoin dehydrogenase alpha subunit